MRTQQLQIDLSGVTKVFDTTGVDIDLGLPAGVTHERCQPAEVTVVDPGTALMVLMGPNSSRHSTLESLDELLLRLRTGGRAILLLGWSIDELPGDWLLDTLEKSGCQITDAIRPELQSVSGIESALVVARVEDAEAWLALSNRFALAEFRNRTLERRIAELSEQLRQVQRSRAAAESRAEMLTSSASFRAGRALVDGARSPLRAPITVPRDLAQIWRSRRSRSAPERTMTERLVTTPIALPSTGKAADRRATIAITAQAGLLVPGRLAEEGLVGFEPSALATFLAAADVAGPGAIFDIGANVGIYAALASAMTDRTVCAFEPWPLLVEVARRFSSDNGLGFTTESLALGAKNGNATFYLSDKSDSSNSLAEGFRKSSNQIQVPVETLDSYVDRTGTVPAILKVDTEATEPDVLAGAVGTIMAHRPWILCEVLAGRVEPRLQEVLAPLGYRWYHVTGEVPFRESVRIVGDRSYENLMWLFAPEKPGEDFWAALRERTAALLECTAERGRQLHAAR